MQRPPAGLCLPVVLVRVRDGDTVEVRLQNSTYVWAIRLIDCWAEELNTPEGKAAKRFAEEVCREADATGTLYLWVPAPRDVRNLLKNLTFDRIPGHLFVSSDRTLNEMLVLAGHATLNKAP